MQLTVERVGEKTSNDNYIHTLVGMREETVFGIKKQQQVKYMLALTSPLELNQTDDLDIDSPNSPFIVVERVSDTETDQNNNPLRSKWIHLK